MGLFDQILGAIDNPNQQANPDQLSAILNTVQQTASAQGIQPAASNDVLSMLGGYVRSALQQQTATGGRGQAEAIVNQFGGTSPSTAALGAIFNPTQQQQVAQAISQRTGISADAILGMLPMLIPVVLNLLKSGASQPQAGASQPQAGQIGQAPGGNPVLNSFLDADGDGDVDIADAMSMAGEYLGQR
ncbi:MAG: DUF937 domain-containing protein [Drouetiella hepatica Uher 2000/2452]|jgi:hypothetical protein|uniref:DUF937 domain-containing protein n=1 Tax=Drouetiella hepatica Uher 2000/2452 TaxID=904376 RepID=A0A951QCQ1_9CYAN|nr:DUF937 domain-containing protein [Drouetiella hepatica Uher 2000/2452]